jgi:hypothetical protein
VDLFLFDEAGGSTCGPSLGLACGAGGQRKLSVRVDDLLVPSTAFDAGVKLGFGVLVVGDHASDEVNLQGFVVNTHAGAFDLSVFGFEPQSIPSVP